MSEPKKIYADPETYALGKHLMIQLIAKGWSCPGRGSDVVRKGVIPGAGWRSPDGRENITLLDALQEADLASATDVERAKFNESLGDMVPAPSFPEGVLTARALKDLLRDVPDDFPVVFMRDDSDQYGRCPPVVVPIMSFSVAYAVERRRVELSDT